MKEQRAAEFALQCAPDDNNSLESDLGLASCVRQIFVFLSWLLILATFPLSLFFCIRIIPEYKRAVIFRLGRLKGREKGPGLFFVTPCVDQTRTVDLRIRTFEIPPLECITKDAMVVLVEGVVYYHVFNAVLCVTAIEDADHSTRHISSSIVRNLVGSMVARDVLCQRDRLKQNIVVQLDEVTVLWGVKLDRVEIKDIRVAHGVRRVLSHESRTAIDYDLDREDDRGTANGDARRPSQSDTKEDDVRVNRSAGMIDDQQISPTKSLTTQTRASFTSSVSPVNSTANNIQRLSTSNNVRVANGQRNITQRTLINMHNQASSSVSNQETPTSVSTQITPINNQVVPMNVGGQLGIGGQMAQLNTIQYLNWLNNQSSSNNAQPSSLMWPPFEMCFLPVTINTDGQLQSHSANSNVMIPNMRSYDEPTHSPPYANANEAASQPLLRSSGSPNGYVQTMRQANDRSSRSRSPTPPPPPPPPIMSQSQLSELMVDDADMRPIPANSILELSQDNSHFTSHSKDAHFGKKIGAHYRKTSKRPQSSLSISSSSSTLSDSAAVLEHNGKAHVDRSNTKSVPLPGSKSVKEQRSVTSHKSILTIGSSTTIRSSPSRSQPHLESPPQGSQFVTQAQVHVQPKSMHNSKFGTRRPKAESPPPILPPKPKMLENGNDLLLCKATDITSNSLTAGRRSVPVGGPPRGMQQNAHNNGMSNKNQQNSQLTNGQQQVPLPANIGFVPVSLLASANRSVAVSNNMPYAVSSLPAAADANNNSSDSSANKSNFVACSPMNSLMYSTVVNHPMTGIVSSTVIGSPQLQPVKRTLESISSSSTASKKSSQSGYAPGHPQRPNSNLDSNLKVAFNTGNVPPKAPSPFVSFAVVNNGSSTRANNSMSNV